MAENPLPIFFFHLQSIKVLNQAIADEMWAIHQYMYFHFLRDYQGHGPLAALFKKTTIEEMLHTKRLAERVLFLKASREVAKIHNISEMLNKAKKMEQMSARDHNGFARQCMENADSATKRIFEDLVIDEGRHLDQFETQEEHIEKYG